MTDIDKIKAEIKRRRNAIIDFPVNHTVTLEAKCAIRSMTNGLLSFIESLGKEQPQGLDEAAEEYAKSKYGRKIPSNLPDRCRGCFAPLMYAFKAGAKWMAEQGVSFEYEVEDKTMELGYGKLVGLNPIINLPDSFDNGDKVIVQVRKKDRTLKLEI